MKSSRTIIERTIKFATAVGLVASLCACGGNQPIPSPPEVAIDTPQVILSYDGATRDQFNKTAVLLNLPVYWREDTNGDKKISPNEVVELLFFDRQIAWTSEGEFTSAFNEAYELINSTINDSPDAPPLPEAEAKRIAAVQTELNQGRSTLVYNDLRSLDETSRKMVSHLLTASKLIDDLYATQNGSYELKEKIGKVDPASQRLFSRNWTHRCVAPQTEKDPTCSALSAETKLTVSSYPAELQNDPDFCEKLNKHKNAEKLMDPFVVVRQKEGQLIPVPITEAYSHLTGPIASELEKAAALLEGNESESSLRDYLLSASEGFRTNNWFPADEKWSSMNAMNSNWYLRVGPDETYWEPCSRKAGFHLTLARINQDSLEWQEKLVPVQQQLEDNLAKLIGKPYKARKVTFHLPDFIDIVTNAGNDRVPLGATIGQSLPNWGPVASEGRGRTVVMSNLYTDQDSLRIRREQAESLFAPSTMAAYSSESTASLLGIILHEAAHNLGPSHEYSYKGKTDDQAMGGPLATVMEELKAQTSALWFVEFLEKEGIISEELANQTYISNLGWAFGHISRGMYSASGRSKPYSHLAAIQVGFFMDQGVMTFDKEALSANGKDKGTFIVELEKLPAASEKLMKMVGRIKAKNDKKAAQKLVDKYVDTALVPMSLIAERILRHSKASFVYALNI